MLLPGAAQRERIDMDDLSCSRELLRFIKESPSAFHTVAAIRSRLDAAGFAYLPEHDSWTVEPGGAYYTIRNGSSIIAFKAPNTLSAYHFQMSAAHGDSPTYKVKAAPELAGPAEYLRLNVEGYGGMIDYTWLDRPLSVAGRVMVEHDGTIESRLLSIDRDILLIPSVAIHMNRQVNEGFAFNRAVDLCPLFSAGALERGAFDALVAHELDVEPTQVLGRDLVLVNRQEGVIWGAENEFVSAGHLDDLQCAYASLEGFLTAKQGGGVAVYACFDNEEVGSGTKQGAKSTFLHDVLLRLTLALGLTEADYMRALAGSMLVSCDNANAVHPNHPEHADAEHRPVLNGGVVIKYNAAQRYATDGVSAAVFRELCRAADVPVQVFANRSDKRGGSTLGNLSNAQVSVHALDIGLPQLAMHSAYETAGVRDTAWGVAALKAFFEADLTIEGAERARIG